MSGGCIHLFASKFAPFSSANVKYTLNGSPCPWDFRGLHVRHSSNRPFPDHLHPRVWKRKPKSNLSQVPEGSLVSGQCFWQGQLTTGDIDLHYVGRGSNQRSAWQACLMGFLENLVLLVHWLFIQNIFRVMSCKTSENLMIHYVKLHEGAYFYKYIYMCVCVCMCVICSYIYRYITAEIQQLTNLRIAVVMRPFGDVSP